MVYVGSDDGNLYAVNAIDGEQIWALPTGDVIFSSPAVVDGVVYVGRADHNLYAVDAATGQATLGPPHRRRRRLLSGRGRWCGLCRQAVLTTTSTQVDASTGEEIWAFPAGDDIGSSPAVVDGVVYVGSWDGSLYAVDATSGTQRWSYETEGSITSSPAVVDGVVYIGAHGQPLYAIGNPN